MKKTLVDLWYGNIDPQEHAPTNPQVPDLLKLWSAIMMRFAKP